jgi:hypothetical protein
VLWVGASGTYCDRPRPADGKGTIMLDIDVWYALICPTDAQWMFDDWKEAERRRHLNRAPVEETGASSGLHLF